MFPSSRRYGNREKSALTVLALAVRESQPSVAPSRSSGLVDILVPLCWVARIDRSLSRMTGKPQVDNKPDTSPIGQNKEAGTNAFVKR